MRANNGEGMMMLTGEMEQHNSSSMSGALEYNEALP